MRKSSTFNDFNGVISADKPVSHSEGFANKESLNEIPGSLMFELFLGKRKKMLSRTGGFMLFGKKGVDFFSVYEMLDPHM